jgi:Ca2+-binding EF-hand superfamily protein
VLRWFGIATTLQQVQTLLEQLDFDGSGRLEFGEFVKLMRRLHQEQAVRVRRLFDQLTMQQADPYIPINALPAAVALFEGAPADPLLVAGAMEKAGLRDAVGSDLESTRRVATMMKKGCRDSSPIFSPDDRRKSVTAVKRQTLTAGLPPLCVEDLSPSSGAPRTPQQRETTPRGHASRRGFQEFFRQWSKVAVDEVRQRAGYSALEVARLRDAFNMFDKDGSGTIESTEFRDLIAKYFPDATKSRQGQKEVLKMMKDARDDNCEADRPLDFNEFLQLIRMCDDRRDQADIEMEKQVLQECDLSQEEADGFRQIFTAHVDWTGELEMDKIALLLSEVIDISEKQMMRLVQIVREVHPHGRSVARFPQFLRLIVRLAQENVGGVNASTTRILKNGSGS